MQQKGRNDLKLASLRRDREWVVKAREVAFEIVDRDPELAHHELLAEEVDLLLGEDGVDRSACERGGHSPRDQLAHEEPPCARLEPHGVARERLGVAPVGDELAVGELLDDFADVLGVGPRPAQELVAQLLDPVLAASQEPERPLPDLVQRLRVARHRLRGAGVGHAVIRQAAGPPAA